MEIITGETPDLSEYLDFGFYDWVTYRNNAGLGVPQVGQWLGVSHRVGHLMSYWILPETGIPVFCTTLQRITNLEKQTGEYKARMKDFDVKLDQKCDVQSNDLKEQIQEIPQTKLLCLEDKDEEFKEELNRVIDNNHLKYVNTTLNGVDTTNTT